MPYRIPENAGKPYRPSNGSEGELFKAEFCDRCRRDNFDDDTGEGGCPILLRTLFLDVDDEGYPPEWTHDGLGEPVCTAFEPRETDA